jgi:hypothetical protein
MPAKRFCLAFVLCIKNTNGYVAVNVAATPAGLSKPAVAGNVVLLGSMAVNCSKQ